MLNAHKPQVDELDLKHIANIFIYANHRGCAYFGKNEPFMKAKKCGQIAPECVSDRLIFKFFHGACPRTPLGAPVAPPPPNSFLYL